MRNSKLNGFYSVGAALLGLAWVPTNAHAFGSSPTRKAPAKRINLVLQEETGYHLIGGKAELDARTSCKTIEQAANARLQTLHQVGAVAKASFTQTGARHCDDFGEMVMCPLDRLTCRISFVTTSSTDGFRSVELEGRRAKLNLRQAQIKKDPNYISSNVYCVTELDRPGTSSMETPPITHERCVLAAVFAAKLNRR